MDTLPARARKAFLEKDYRESELLYSKAIKITSVSPDLSLFDHRAACYEKLGRLADAIGDAKHMVQLNSEDARGYLRAGKIYQLLNKDKSALVYYERGCRVVRKTDKLLPTLQKLRKMVEDRLEPRGLKSDPFDRLPLELIWEIFSYFTFVEKLRCLEVSKRWTKTLTGETRFFSRLDLITSLKRRPKPSSIESYIKKSKGTLELLMTDVKLKPPSLQYHFTFCRQLHTLHIPLQRELLRSLPRAGNIRRLKLSTSAEVALNLSEAQDLLMRLPAIHYFSAIIGSNSSTPVKVGHYPNESLNTIKSLEFRLQLPLSVQDLLLIDGYPVLSNLQSLLLPAEDENCSFTITALTQWPPSLQSLSFTIWKSNAGLPSFALPNNLKDLALHCNNRPFQLLGDMPQLRSLTLLGYHGGIESTHMSSLKKSLQSLSLISIACTKDMLDIVLGSLDDLKSLSLVHRLAEVVCDTHLGLLVLKSPSLQDLVLSGSRSITGAALANTIQRLPLLKTLVIDGCDQIGADVVQWIRSKGVHVKQSL